MGTFHNLYPFVSSAMKTIKSTTSTAPMEISQNAVVDELDSSLEDDATSAESPFGVVIDNAETSNEAGDEDPEKLVLCSKSKKKKKATTPFSLRISKERGQELKKTWPEVKSALEKHRLLGALHWRQGSVTITSLSEKTRHKARDLILLLDIGAPPLAAIKLLDHNMVLETIEIGDENSADFNTEEHKQRLRCFVGPNGSNLTDLQRLTNTSIHISNSRIAVVGLSENIKQVRRVVEECVSDRKPPASRLWWVSKDERTNCENSTKKIECDHHKPTPSSKKMEEGLCDHLAIELDILSEHKSEVPLLTTFGTLQPPLGTRRLKAVESIAGFLRSSDSEAAAKDLIRHGGVERVLDLFFKYPFNNFLHGQVEKIIVSCLESTDDASEIVHHLLHDCNLVGKILEAEKSSMPTAVTEGKTAPRMGNFGHIGRIMNKIIELGNGNSMIQAYMEQNSDEWTDWYRDVLQKRNALEDVSQWECGHPKLMVIGSQKVLLTAS